MDATILAGEDGVYSDRMRGWLNGCDRGASSAVEGCFSSG